MRARDFRHQAWDKLRGNWTTAVVSYLIMGLILGAIAFSGIGTLILTGPFVVGFSIIVLHIVRKEKAEIGDLFKGFNDFGRAFVLWLTNQLLIGLWSLLLVIPGIIKTYSYSMSYYILIDNPELSANEARKKSMQLMKGNKWRLFCLHFSFIGWLLLCMLTFGILIFWIEPYMETATAEFYQSLIGTEKAEITEETVAA